MDCAIVSHFGDLHADAVIWACNKLGADAFLIDLYRFFDHAEITIPFPATDHRVVIGERAINQTTAIWMRRPNTSSLFFNHAIHLDDLTYCQIAMRRHAEELLYYLDAFDFVINPVGSQTSADVKAVQLRAATSAGLRIAPTLLTNSATAAADFSRQYDAIAKSHRQYLWTGSEGTYSAAVVPISGQDVETHGPTFRHAPLIIQEKVHSKDEIRVVVMGHTVFAASLGFSNQDGTRLDWRRNLAALDMRRFELSELQTRQIVRVCELLGLQFAAMDFILDEDGDFIFLEVNPCGQWLWMNHEEHGLPLLDAFTKFLLSRDPTYQYDGQTDVTYPAYIEARGEAFIDQEGGSENIHQKPLRDITEDMYSIYRREEVKA